MAETSRSEVNLLLAWEIEVTSYRATRKERDLQMGEQCVRSQQTWARDGRDRPEDTEGGQRVSRCGSKTLR
jgi:hypothetical protein